MKLEKKKEKRRREKVFVEAKVNGLSNEKSAALAFPELSNRQVLRNKGWKLSKREDIQGEILGTLEKKIPGRWAVEILRKKVEKEGPDSIKALNLYFELVGAKRTEHLIKSESKNVNFNIHIQADKIQEALRKARNDGE